MSDSVYTVRNYQPSDFDAYVRLINEVERLEPSGRSTSAQVLREDLGRPNYSPEQDLFLVETEGDMAGYLNIVPEAGVGRVILDCLIRPDHRRRGLASRLLGYATHRARELGAKVAHANIPRDNEVAQIVLPKLGFRFVRRFLRLRLDMSQSPVQSTDQTALDFRHLRRGEEDKLTQIQNRSFADTWGYQPDTVETITYRTSLSNCSPEDVVLACDRDKVVGYCWTRTTREGAKGQRKGQVSMLGVDPDYRGRGAGKGVLLAGLSYLKSKDLSVIELTVDSENKVARALYQSLGFRIESSSLWYEKAIAQPE